MEKYKKNKTVHYDKVTEAWQYIFGTHFHFGYFTTPHMSLEEATLSLNDALLDFGELDENSTVLDVGCGIGSPAFYINERFGCTVVGISTSHKGVDLANDRSRGKGLNNRVRFRVADGTDNKLPADHFDVVWLMESSHTMKDKGRLFKECFRTLKPGGQLLLGDVMPRSRSKMVYYFKTLRQWGVWRALGIVRMRKAFGPAWTESLSYYLDLLKKIGFKILVFKDVGEYVQPTFDGWKQNTVVYEKEIRRYLTGRQLDDFLVGTDLVKDWYQGGILGYGLISAAKPD